MAIQQNTEDDSTKQQTQPKPTQPISDQMEEDDHSDSTLNLSDTYQRVFLKKVLSRKEEKDENWCVIPTSWLKSYKDHISYDTEIAPDDEKNQEQNGRKEDETTERTLTCEPISLEPLIEKRIEELNIILLKKQLIYRVDYELIHEDDYDQLRKWYGGDEKIVRKVIEEGVNATLRVNLYPIWISAGIYKDANSKIEFNMYQFSEDLNIMQLTDSLLEKLHVQGTDARLWSCLHGNPYRLYIDAQQSKTLEEVITKTAQQVCIELKDNEGEWPLSYDHFDRASRQSKFVSSSRTSGSKSYTSSYKEYDEDLPVRYTPGVCGLSNLGNTCFMNSALQCLTKAEKFKTYFVDKQKHVDEINTENILGMHGQVADEFAKVMNNIWSGKYSHFAPRTFKSTIGKFAPQFMGYAQHDSQELISFLLDGLHEDLNRVKKKPLTGQVDSKGRKDAVVAKESWDIHLKRNRSIIVDWFQGQLKSTLVCPNEKCISENVVSITFDPFMYFGLPIPNTQTKIIPVIFYRYGNPSTPIKYGVKTPKKTSSKALREGLAKLTGVDENNIVLADIFSHKIYRFISNESNVSKITDSDVTVAYEVPSLPEDCHNDYADKFVGRYSSTTRKEPPFIGVRVVKNSYSRDQYDNSIRKSSSNIGRPIIVAYDEKTTKKQIYDECLKFAQRYLKEDTPYDFSKKESFFPTPSNDPVEKQEEENEDDPNKMQEEQEEKKQILFSLVKESSYHSRDGEILYYSDEPFIKLDEDGTTVEKQDIMMEIDEKQLKEYWDDSKWKEDIVHETASREANEKEQRITLDDCFKLFSKKEKLSKKDTWYCGNCKEHVQASKKMDIWKLPEILVICLKRFQYDEYSRDKIETLIDFPLDDFDLSKYLPDEAKNQKFTKYDLFGISNHFGGLGGGHYTAYAKIEDKWYEYDDSMAREVSASSVKTNHAYCLFYKAVNSDGKDIDPVFTDPDMNENEEDENSMKE